MMKTTFLSVQTVLLLCLLMLVTLAYADNVDEKAALVMARLGEITSNLPFPKEKMDTAKQIIGSYFFLVDSKRESCRNHSIFLFNAFMDNELWALKMFDAGTKIGSGLMEGSIQDLGSYDECVGVKAPGEIFQGQHCVVETRGLLPETLMDSFNLKKRMVPGTRVDFLFSVCVPNTCTHEDVKGHFDAAWKSINATAILFNTSCASAKVIPFERKDYIAMWVLLTLCILLLLCTLFDFFVEDSNQLLTSFSVLRNLRQLFTVSDNPDSLSCIHGIRVIGMAWVVMSHRLMSLTNVPTSTFKGFLDSAESFWWAPLQEGPLAVEVFLLMAGLLLSYNLMTCRMRGMKINYLLLVINRYKRLTPSLAMMVFVYSTLILHLADGPVWTRLMTGAQENCQKFWWTNLLFINNYYHLSDACMLHTYYISMDFQMYLIGPILLMIFMKNQTLGTLLILICLISTLTSAIVTVAIDKLPASGFFLREAIDFGAFMTSYAATHNRASSFIIGIIVGYFIYKIKQEQVKIRVNKMMLVVGWALSATLILTPLYLVTVFSRPDYVYDPWFDPIYHVFRTVMMSLGVSWIIVVCTLGYGGYVNQFLSWRALVPLSRLSYGVYLIHLLVQRYLILSTRRTVTVNALSPWHAFPEDFLLSNFAAAVLYLAVDAPFNNIFKLQMSK